MPIVKVVNSNYFNQGNPITYSLDGAQYIENVLTLPTAPDTTTIYLSEDLHNLPGYYVLFDYSESTAPTPIVGNISQITIDDSELTSPLLSGTTTVFNDTTSKQIVVIVYADQNVGTQYIDGVLTINSPMTIYLSSYLYITPGTYVLFDWSGGGSFTGSITNITIVPPAGRAVDTGVSSNGCAVSGSTITVTLI